MPTATMTASVSWEINNPIARPWVRTATGESSHQAKPMVNISSSTLSTPSRSRRSWPPLRGLPFETRQCYQGLPSTISRRILSRKARGMWRQHLRPSLAPRKSRIGRQLQMLEETSIAPICTRVRLSLEAWPRPEAPDTNLSIIGLNISLESVRGSRMTQVCLKSTSARMHSLLVINSNRHRQISLRKVRRAAICTSKPNMAITWDYKVTLLTLHLYSRPIKIFNSISNRTTRTNPYLAIIAWFRPGFHPGEPRLRPPKNSNGQKCQQGHPGTPEIKCCII